MPPDPALAIAGVLLAGGASRRFGAPKAQAVLGGQTLGQIAINRLSRTCAPLAVAGETPTAYPDIAHLPDAADLPNGPLSGILAGLEWALANAVQWLAVSPCDMPLLPPKTHKQLLGSAIAARAPLAMVTGPDGPSPLCSVWSTSLAPAVRERLTSGHPPIWQYAVDLGATTHHLSDQNFTLNVNAPSDLDRAAQLTRYHWWLSGQSAHN